MSLYLGAGERLIVPHEEEVHILWAVLRTVQQEGAIFQ